MFFFSFKGVKLIDGKPLGGQGRLTLKRVDVLQRFYGNALRSNKGNPEAASAEAMAGLYHYAGDHRYCPTRNDTWCTFKQDELSGSNNSQPVEDPFTPAMVALMRPIYEVRIWPMHSCQLCFASSPPVNM